MFQANLDLYLTLTSMFQANLDPQKRQLLQDLQHQYYLQQQHAKMQMLNQQVSRVILADKINSTLRPLAVNFEDR